MSSSPTAWWPGLAVVQGFPPRAAGALRLAEPHVVFACSPPWGFPCSPPRTIAQPCAELSARVSLQEFHGFGGRVPGERTSVQRAAVVSASASVSAASHTEAPVLVAGGRSGLGLLRVGCGLLGVSPSLPGVPASCCLRSRSWSSPRTLRLSVVTVVMPPFSFIILFFRALFLCSWEL